MPAVFVVACCHDHDHEYGAAKEQEQEHDGNGGADAAWLRRTGATEWECVHCARETHENVGGFYILSRGVSVYW